MNYLKEILNAEQIDMIYDTFDENALEKLNDINIKKILLYLNNYNIDYWEDILTMYTDLFLIDYSEFVKKFEMIRHKYGENFVDIIGSNMNILEEML